MQKCRALCGRGTFYASCMVDFSALATLYEAWGLWKCSELRHGRLTPQSTHSKPFLWLVSICRTHFSAATGSLSDCRRDFGFANQNCRHSNLLSKKQTQIILIGLWTSMRRALPGMAWAASAALVLESRPSMSKCAGSGSGRGHRGWKVGASGMWTSLKACCRPLFLHILFKIHDPKKDSRIQTASRSTHPLSRGELQ